MTDLKVAFNFARFIQIDCLSLLGSTFYIDHILAHTKFVLVCKHTISDKGFNILAYLLSGDILNNIERMVASDDGNDECVTYRFKNPLGTAATLNANAFKNHIADLDLETLREILLILDSLDIKALPVRAVL